jgi:hypothetical protein
MTRMMSGLAAASLSVLALAASAPANAQGVVEVRHGWRGGGVGIYVGPGYDYGYGGYDGYYSYGPSYGYYDDDDDDDDYREYRRHSHRWTKQRFEHPLGRK